ATLTEFDQFARVAELLASEEPSEWPTFGSMLELRGFADEVRQFLQRAQESLLTPDELLATASERGSGGWVELAGFYRRYLDVLATAGEVDFAGLVAQAARAAELTADDDALFDHVLVDDYQDATLAEEALVTHLAGRSLTVAGDLASHVFSFQGTTDVPLRRLADADEGVSKVDPTVRHRSPLPLSADAWLATHTSEEHAAIARELRRVHVEEGVPWREMAVVVRRHGSHVGGLLRALDDASVPRVVPESGLSLL